MEQIRAGSSGICQELIGICQELPRDEQEPQRVTPHLDFEHPQTTLFIPIDLSCCQSPSTGIGLARHGGLLSLLHPFFLFPAAFPAMELLQFQQGRAGAGMSPRGDAGAPIQ